MSMSIGEALGVLQATLASAEEANGLAQALAAKLDDIANDLARVDGSGIAPQRMFSTRALAHETQHIQGEQRERMFSLLQGINELIG